MARLQTISMIFCPFLFFAAPILGMHVESYWESWVLKDYPNDWCALLKEVPASPIGSTEGANYVSIGKKHFMIRFVNHIRRKLGQNFFHYCSSFVAFGDFSGGFGGIEVNESIVLDGIKAIHDKGGKAKVAYGGALYDMSSYIHNK